MGKQTMVIKLSIENKKKKTKALKTAVGVEGVISVELGDDNRLVLVGEGTDVIELTILLRKKLGYADVISVTSADENSTEKEEEEDDDDRENTIITQRDNYYPSYQYGVPSPYFYPYDPYFQRCIEY